MIPMMLSSVCKAECDLKPKATSNPDSIEGWQAALNALGGTWLKVKRVTGENVECDVIAGYFQGCSAKGWSVAPSKQLIRDGIAVEEIIRRNHMTFP
jgi:hypothetical protein